MHILDELDARGLISDVTHREELSTLMSKGPVSLYAGYDPTADSMHLGNLVPVVLQWRLQRAGHRPLAVVGGATGMVGDPSGKSAERSLLDAETLARNVAVFRAQLERLLDFSPGPTGALLLNNADWTASLGFIEVLRDIGKHLSVNYMIAKDSVRARLEDREQGISYTEFSYMLLQAYDFVHLAREHDCRLQVGGSDQWGNITAGTELMRKMGGEQLYGLVAPLLLDSSGAKMGKTASGTRIWLDPDRTSPYAFYQYLYNVNDEDVDKLYRIFSPRPLTEVEELLGEHQSAPERREAQRALARELTGWVHGEDAVRRAEAASQVMFGGSLESLTDADLVPLLADLPSSELASSELDSGIGLLELLVRTELAPSKGGARRLVQQGGVYVNNVRAQEVEAKLTRGDLGTETMILLRSGKKKYHLVRVV